MEREREEDGRAGERWLEAILIAQGRRSKSEESNFPLRDPTARVVNLQRRVKLTGNDAFDSIIWFLERRAYFDSEAQEEEAHGH